MGQRFVTTFLCILFISSIGPSVRAAGPEPLPTSEELHKLYDAKDYRTLLQKMVRVMQLKGTAAQAYDRVDLLMMRGESLLQLKDQAAAIQAFDEAFKEATDPKQNVTRKPDQVARVRATDLLVHQSRSFAYTPRHADAGHRPEPISLLDLSKRDDAFKALLDDQLAELTPKAKAAARGMSLPPIIQLIRNLGDLRAVEQVVTKKTEESDKILSEMAERAHTLMDAEVDRLAPAEARINRNAHARTRHENVQRDNNGNVIASSTTTTMQGLSPNDARDLKQIVGTSEQIAAASTQFRDISTGELASKFAALCTKSEKLAGDASQTLSDDYRPVTTQTGGFLNR